MATRSAMRRSIGCSRSRISRSTTETASRCDAHAGGREWKRSDRLAFVYELYTMSWADSFDPEQPDVGDPFEIDERNVHHLAKHAPFTSETCSMRCLIAPSSYPPSIAPPSCS